MERRMIDWTPDIDLNTDAVLVVRRMPAAAYHAVDRLNASRLVKYAKSTRDGALCEANGTETTMEMRLGTAFHARLLEPKDFAARMIVREDIGPSAEVTMAKAEAENPDAIILAKGWTETIEAMVSAVKGHPDANAIIFGLEGTHRELTIFWSETVHGAKVRCKARLDFISPDRNAVLDVKSAASADPQKWVRYASDAGYHIQGSWYCRAAAVARLASSPNPWWLAIEKKPPYRVELFAPNPDDTPSVLDQGWAMACLAMHRYAAHHAGKPDPKPPARFHTFRLSPWHEFAALEEEYAQFTRQHEELPT
jgi:hypothetical protein